MLLNHWSVLCYGSDQLFFNIKKFVGIANVFPSEKKKLNYMEVDPM